MRKKLLDLFMHAADHHPKKTAATIAGLGMLFMIVFAWSIMTTRGLIILPIFFAAIGWAFYNIALSVFTGD